MSKFALNQVHTRALRGCDTLTEDIENRGCHTLQTSLLYPADFATGAGGAQNVSNSASALHALHSVVSNVTASRMTSTSAPLRSTDGKLTPSLSAHIAEASTHPVTRKEQSLFSTLINRKRLWITEILSTIF